MARRGRGAQRRALRSKRLLALGLQLLSVATSIDDEHDALLVLCLARQTRHQASRSGRFGPRGAYDGEKVPLFLETLLHKFSDKRFKAWLR